MKTIKVRAPSLLDRLRLFFVRAKVDWNHEEGIVTKYKYRKGVFYVLKQEPLQYGDRRNAQIDRMEEWL